MLKGAFLGVLFGGVALLWAMTDGTAVVVNTIVSGIVAVTGLWFTYRTRLLDLNIKKVETKVEVVDEKVESVGAKVDHVDKKVEKVAVVVDASHVLQNSQSLAQDKLIWDLKQKEADRTRKPEDIKEATAAKLVYEEHKSRQDAVDAGAKDGKIEPASDEENPQAEKTINQP